MADVRKHLKALAEKALRTTPYPVEDREPPSNRMTDALSALRILVDNWDELVSGASGLSGAALLGTPRGMMLPRATPMMLGSGTQVLEGRPSRRRPTEPELLSLLAEHKVQLVRAKDVDVLLFPCRSCGETFDAKDDVLVVLRDGPEPRKPHAATHLKCRWWWWESPHSPLRSKT